MERIREVEAKVANLRQQRLQWAERAELKTKLMSLDPSDIRYILAVNGLEVRGDSGMLDLFGYSEDHRLHPGELRKILTTIVERVDLDPITRKFTVRYRLPIPTGVKMASPRGTA